MALVRRNEAGLWSDAPTSKFGGFDAMGIGKFGAEDATIPGPGEETLYVQDENGRPFLAIQGETPPGGSPNFVINFLEQYAQNKIRQAKSEAREISVQWRFHQYGVLTNPTGWVKLIHFGLCRYGDEGVSGPQIDYTSTAVRGTQAVRPQTYISEWFKPTLTAQDPPNAVVNANDIIFVSEIVQNVIAFPGPDQIGFVGLDAAVGVAAKLLVTIDGGGIWENADADPFGADEDIIAVRYKVVNPRNGLRVVTANGSATGIAFADVGWSDPTATVWTDTATTGIPTALAWKHFKELLVATASGLFISKDAGESIDSQLSTNANITGLVVSPDSPRLDTDYVYAFGASNTLLRKAVGSDTVEVLAGPSGGGAFHSLVVAFDGTLYAGNGTSLFRSDDGGESAAGWTELKDFGAAKAVTGIGLAKHDPHLLWLAVDDSTPATGEFWLSADGQSFEEQTVPTNDGFNAMYMSPNNPNLAYVCGDDDTAQPVILKVAP